MAEDFTDLCKRLEHFETDPWAVQAILDAEILTPIVLDPCTGSGVLAKAARERGYDVVPIDIHDYGIEDALIQDFLTLDDLPFDEFSVLLNPPYSLAEKFVDKCFELGARKVVCFQRFSWWEGSYLKGKKRGQWWAANPPNRVYICGDRANCWRHDIPKDQRNSSTPTAHSWFVWEKGQPKGTLLGHVYKCGSNT